MARFLKRLRDYVVLGHLRSKRGSVDHRIGNVDALSLKSAQSEARRRFNRKYVIYRVRLEK